MKAQTDQNKKGVRKMTKTTETIGDEFRRHYKNFMTDKEIQGYIREKAIELCFDGTNWYLRFSPSMERVMTPPDACEVK